MKRALLAVGGFPVMVEIAETQEEQRRGLMGRRRLQDGHGMLFSYSESGDRAFWMKDTIIPLDVAFADNGAITSIGSLEPLSERMVGGYGDMALEMPAGWFADHGVGAGHRIRLVMSFGEVGNG
jgi:uncharacterized protein